MREKSIFTPLMIGVIFVMILVLAGIPKKIEVYFEANAYYLYCKVKYKDEEFCSFARKRILSVADRIGYHRELPEEDRQVLKHLHKTFLPFHVALFVLLFFIAFSGIKKTRKNSSRQGKKPPKLFREKDLQRAVENFYRIYGLTRENENLIKQVYQSGRYPPYVAFALFMILARQTGNFAAREVALGVKDETARKIIFASGRPSIPPSVQSYFVLAEQILSERRSDSQDRQGQPQSRPSDRDEPQAA